MVVVRHAFTAPGCSHCRLVVLKLFTYPTNALSGARPGGFLHYRARSVVAAPIRAFSSQPIRFEPSSASKSAEENLGENLEQDLEDDDALEDHHQKDLPYDNAAKDSAITTIPWYLQVEPPRHVASIEPLPLPEVPHGAPAVVGSLLEYVSEDLGLHDLSLLDLRGLSPPPALGPNLFMLFGTARSERHLNVSAGRLLRWLRAKHRIHAQADGLLGPNERKTKLRRKAKRARLVGDVEDTDDGISTGWICVNLGTVGHSREESAVVAEDGRVAGFGVARDGSTIVAQIMTESRRAEMGLEALWKQASGQPVDDSSTSEAENLDNLHPLERAILSSSRPDTASKNTRFEVSPRRTPFDQVRFFSMGRSAVHESTKPDPLLHVRSNEALGQILRYDAPQKHRLVELLQSRLQDLSPLSARHALGVLNQQQIPTPFLRLSKAVCQTLPPHQSWGFRLAVQTKAYESSNSGPVEALEDVRQLVEEMRLYGIEATRQQYLQLLTCIYSSDVGGLNEKSKLALELLKTVQQRGQPILANDIIVTIIEAAARSSEPSKPQQHLELIQRLEDLLLQADVPSMDESLLMRLMETHARLRNWEGFWNVWRIPPRYLRPRSAAMYIHIYNLAAATRSRSLCTMILRRCFQEMLTEDPPVMPTGAVLKAILDCIRVADPQAEQIAQSLSAGAAPGRSGRREFVKLIRGIQLLAR
ncbi:ATPase synthesis protein 25 mitochondrial [Parahypoxylon ruwenzoriense]